MIASRRKLRSVVSTALLVLAAATATERPNTAKRSLERRLYVADPVGISVYDIDDGHKLLRKIDIPDSGDYKGIAASPQLGKLYVTSYKKDELICLDLKTDKVDWRKHLGKYADSMQITPDGKRMYLPFREEDDWKVVDTATGDVLAEIKTEHGRNYDDHPIANPVGPQHLD